MFSLPMLKAEASSISSCMRYVSIPFGLAGLSGSFAITWNTCDAMVAFCLYIYANRSKPKTDTISRTSLSEIQKERERGFAQNHYC